MHRFHDHWAPRRSFLTPIPELETAADLLSEAADALLHGDNDLARVKIAAADIPVVYAYARKIMGTEDPQIHHRRAVIAVPVPSERATSRMPTGKEKAELYARDGWCCRFCECRVVPLEVRDRLRKLLPGAITIGPRAADCHAAFLALSAVPDHVVPHSLGGGNGLDNLVTACWPCNNGRGPYALEEMGLVDPRTVPPCKRDGWDGLTRVLSLQVPARSKPDQDPIGSASTIAPLQVSSTSPFHTTNARQTKSRQANSRLDEDTFFTSLEVRETEYRSRLKNFVLSLHDQGVTAEYKHSLILRFSAVSRKPVSAGFVMKSGAVEVGDGYYHAVKLGQTAAGESYLARIAAIVGGVVVTHRSGHRTVVQRSGKMIRLEDLLDDADRWKRAIADLVASLVTVPSSNEVTQPVTR